MVSRREFIKGLSVLGVSSLSVSALTGCVIHEAVNTSNEAHRNKIGYLSAYYDGNNHRITRFLVSGERLFDHPVDVRCHDALALPDGGALFIGRRPATKAFYVSAQGFMTEVNALQGRHFYGHAALDKDDRAWFTENQYDDQQSVLSCQSFHKSNSSAVQKDTEILTDRVGAHQLAFMSGGEIAAVCMGGIATHPKYPRKKLNLDTMQSSLQLWDVYKRQAVVEQFPPNPQLSIRHIDIAPSESGSDAVVVAAQFQGPAYEVWPLLYRMADSGDQLLAFNAPKAVWQSMNRYVASVAIDSEFAVITCPKANAVHLFSLATMNWLHSISIADAGGVISLGNQRFLITNGLGEIICVRSKNNNLLLEHSVQLSNTRWDNHVS